MSADVLSSALPIAPPPDRLHPTLVRLAEGDGAVLGEVYDLSVERVLGLALARARGDRARAEDLVRRTYAEVRSRAADYPASGRRPLTWLLCLTQALPV